MKVNMIDSTRIESMVAQLRAAAAKAQGGLMPVAETEKPAAKVSFADALAASLNQVNSMQKQAETMGQRFALGDDKVNLSDVMIAGQKASIAFQATVQVRNKLVSAYQDIMNMHV